MPVLYQGDEIGMVGGGDPDSTRPMTFGIANTAPHEAFMASIKKLSAIRAQHSVLQKGTRTQLSSNADTLAYAMTDGSDNVYVALNRADSVQVVGGL